MSRRIEIKDVNELMNALGDSEKLYGYTPAEKYEATSFVYPIVAITNEENKTYVVKQANEVEEVKPDEPKPEEPKQEAVKSEVNTPTPAPSSNNDEATKKAKKKKIAMIVGFTVLGVAIVVGIILAIYFGMK